jgi:hypothetical protein
VFRLGRFFRVGHIIVCVFSKGKQTHTRAGGFYITYMCMRVNFEFKFKNFFLLEKTIFREKQKRSILNQEEIEIYLVFFFFSSARRPVPLALLLFEHFFEYVYVCVYISEKRACCACVFENSAQECCNRFGFSFLKKRGKKKNGENPKQQKIGHSFSLFSGKIKRRAPEKKKSAGERETRTAPRHIYRDRETEEEEEREDIS